jgi:hypothetical protein
VLDCSGVACFAVSVYLSILLYCHYSSAVCFQPAALLHGLLLVDSCFAAHDLLRRSGQQAAALTALPRSPYKGIRVVCYCCTRCRSFLGWASERRQYMNPCGGIVLVQEYMSCLSSVYASRTAPRTCIACSWQTVALVSLVPLHLYIFLVLHLHVGSCCAAAPAVFQLLSKRGAYIVICNAEHEMVHLMLAPVLHKRCMHLSAWGSIVL